MARLPAGAIHTYAFLHAQQAGCSVSVVAHLIVIQVIRNYHGHLSGVYSLALHPTLPLLVTGGRDSAVRVWDIRTRLQVHCMSGHASTIASLLTNKADPQIISGSHDKQIRLWDLRKAATMKTLTYHKKSVRGLAMHDREV
jgi:pleiotropic regulator 1